MNTTPSNMGDIKSTYRLIKLGLIGFILSVLFSYLGAADLAAGVYRTNHIWVVAHTFILGFLIMIVMGVMYQLVPVALLVPIYSERLGRIQIYIYSSGVFGLIYGLWNMDTLSMVIFGTTAFTGILLFVVNLFLSVRNIVKWNMMSTIIMTAVFYLFMTVLFGLLLVLDFYYIWWPDYRDQILYSHITFGTIGWLTSVIIGFSYKMAPMFSLAHGYTEKYAKWIYVGVQAGIGAIVTGVFGKWNMITGLGFLFILIGYMLFTMQVHQIMKHKMKSVLDLGFRVAIYAVYGTAIWLILAPFGFLLFGKAFLLPFVYLFIVGWIGFSILGYLYKIVPFLWWTDKYSEKVGKEKVPMLKDMVNESKGKWAFIFLFAGLIGNVLAIGLHFYMILMITNTIFLFGAILYSYFVLRVFKM